MAAQLLRIERTSIVFSDNRHDHIIVADGGVPILVG